MIPKLTLFGERIAIKQIEEAIEGEIVIPAGTTLSNYQLGRVLATGPKATHAKVGDVVLFQIPTHIMASATYRWGGEEAALIHQADIIGKLKTNVVNVANFEIAGGWVLLDIEIQGLNAGLSLPQNVQPNLVDIHFTVRQIGDHVAKDRGYEVGDKAMVERQRCNPLKIEDKEYAFCDQQWVFGTYEESRIITLDPPSETGRLILN